MFYNSLNSDSMWRINNIVTGFKNYPAYSTYDIKSYIYDHRAGVHAIEISKNGQPINLWLFYPGVNGEINSIAAYGNYLQSHLEAIRSTMTVFGMPVKSAEMDYSGLSDFIDIFLKPY